MDGESEGEVECVPDIDLKLKYYVVDRERGSLVPRPHPQREKRVRGHWRVFLVLRTIMCVNTNLCKLSHEC